MMFNTEELAMLGYKKLEMRFNNKINPSEYALSYSGGNDSEILRWFIKDKGYDIPIIGVNTQREHNEIRKRLYRNCDEVLLPLMSMEEIKGKYGMPCFTKNQDEYIHRYQKGSRAKSTMDKFTKTGSGTGKYGLNKIATSLTLSGKLHKVSNKCCVWTKEEPLIQWAKKNNYKSIIGIRQEEGTIRSGKHTCLANNGNFFPAYDLNDRVVKAMQEYFQIEIPKVYNCIPRTGCIGCPYGRNIEKELAIVTPAQRKYAIKSFKDSYDVKGVNYTDKQMILFNYEERK